MKSDESKRKEINKTTNALIQQSNRNVIKCSHGKSESPEHRRKKAEICLWAWENNIQFCTEAIFTTKGRADIILLDLGVAIEILHSETINDFKKKFYPIETIPVKSDMWNGELLDMLNELNSTNGDAAQYYIKKLTGEQIDKKRKYK